MYVYSDLIESQVVEDAQAIVLRIVIPWGQPGDTATEEVKLPTYHQLSPPPYICVFISGNQYKGRHGPTDTIYFRYRWRYILHFRRRAIL